MTQSVRLWIGIVAGIASGVLLLTVLYYTGLPLSRLTTAWMPAQPKQPLTPKLDRTGPYVIFATKTASESFKEAIEIAQELHPDSAFHVFLISDLEQVQNILISAQPYYAMVFIMPEELDVNFAWSWLRLTTMVDDDPFVDVRTGFITGKNPEAATRFITRTKDATDGKLVLPGAVTDNLGPNMSTLKTSFLKNNGSFFLPCFENRMGVSTISHGVKGFTRERLTELENAGIIHFGGHGYPDRIVDGLPGKWTADLKLSPAVIFNGACYTGVTDRWFDITGAQITEKHVAPEESFCLGLLSNNTVGYLAALHPDHGIPVYQEMEYVAYTGETLGYVMKHTHDGVILANGCRLPDLSPLTDGMKRPSWSPSEFMLIGTASRILVGDPSLTVFDCFTNLPFIVQASLIEDGALSVEAVLDNLQLRSSYTDTYHSDMASNKQLFNDCARISLLLSQECKTVSSIDSVKVTSDGKGIPCSLKGFAVEEDVAGRMLRVQVDVPTKEYMQSQLRRSGVKLTFIARP